MLRSLVVLSFFALAACQPAPVGVRNADFSPDSAGQCAALCGQAGLSLDSIVIMADNVGCVCRATMQPQGAPGAAPEPAPATTTGAAAAGGMAAILMQEQARRAAAASRPVGPKR